MTSDATVPAAIRSFEEALRLGQAKGYAVCAKPLRFSQLPDTVATTYAEIEGQDRYHVFEVETDALKRMEQISPEDRLGWVYSVREISCLSSDEKNVGPKLDVRGYPFSRRGFIVDASGAVTEWTHPNRLGWRGSKSDTPIANDGQAPGPGLMRLIGSWLRSLLGRTRSDPASPSIPIGIAQQKK